MASAQNFSSYEGIPSQTAMIHGDVPLVTPLSYGHIELDLPAFMWTTPRIILFTLSLFFLPKALSTMFSRKSDATKEHYRRPVPVPYLTPILGNLFLFLYAPQELAKSISQRLGKSGIFSLNMVAREVYIVSGAEYLNAIWKDTQKVMMSHDGLNLSLRNMFGVPGKDMPFFRSDRTGSAHDPHTQSPVRNADQRVSYPMFKATAEYLSGANLTSTAKRYQAALKSQLAGIPVEDEWVEMDDFFSFARGLVANSTCQAILGSKFLAQFPDFIDNFYAYDSRIRRFLQGWPRFLIPRAWRARSRCIEIMREWRKILNVQEFDGSPMMLKRWSYHEKWNISDDAIAAQDLGILWGTFSNAIVVSFWLCWHTLQDPRLLTAATAEVEECQREDADGSLSLDTTKLASQPLLQSMHAEALRKYVAVYIPRTTEYGATQVLDYQIPKNKLMVINSAMAHTDERNWNLGTEGEHPVDKFWGERFLTPSTEASAEASDMDNGSYQGKPTFSLNRYKGAWVPFGGGVHQCPARHWVKNQMLISLAMITGAFEIELLNSDRDLSVDLSKYGLGTLNPGEKAPFRIRRKRTSV